MTKRRWAFGTALMTLLWAPLAGGGQESGDATLIAGAIEALPEAYREGPEVRAWTDDGGQRTLQEGSNGFICLADRPGNETFQSTCYHESLEPFIAYGRVLRAQGLAGMEYQEARWRHIEAGGLNMPSGAAMLYNFYHQDPDFDPRTDDPDTGARLHAIYIAGATTESTGLPAQAPAGQPWLMWPGKPSSHIMISIAATAGG